MREPIYTQMMMETKEWDKISGSAVHLAGSGVTQQSSHTLNLSQYTKFFKSIYHQELVSMVYQSFLAIHHTRIFRKTGRPDTELYHPQKANAEAREQIIIHGDMESSHLGGHIIRSEIPGKQFTDAVRLTQPRDFPDGRSI